MPKTIDQILCEVNQVVGDILREPGLDLKMETTAKDVKNWDSLNHIEIIVAVEKHFGIKFNFAELQKFKNVGQMCESILKRTN
ncbi:MAG: acyl carrier protein [Verrucomicrobiota bacterium]|jgi:acyl carrier protein